ncbi:LSM12 homolog A-like [Anopheles bellator]|uniref:LSM12 homolog A-like n=1 Tax=Anopheles bellator TaxID=139047 RepID=UPI0026484D06|nr:LSM12 homolog A-like [Anopheles bellator]
MAAIVQECFSIGSTVVCTTCYNANIEGEVLAFDQQSKMLILKCPSASKSAKLNDVYIVNLAMCSDVQVKKEVCIVPEQPLSLNLQRLSTRARNQVEQKKRQLTALAAGVSPEGQNLFMAIARTIEQVTWVGPKIVVFNEVMISPPYKIDNVHTNCPSDQRKLSYVKKIVEKHVNDQANINQSTSADIAAN